MSTITIDENQLEEIVSKAVQRHLKSTFQDMDEVRKSPAGAIVRLETKIESLVTRAEFKEGLGELKAEIAHFRAESKEESRKLRDEYREGYADLNARLAKVEGMLKLLVALYFALFGIIASWIAKQIFFP
jgi:hypothetical protein